MEGRADRAHADRILDRAFACAAPGARQEPRSADARRGARGGRRHRDLARQAGARQVSRRRPGVRRHRDRLRPGLSLEGLRLVRFTLRAKLALVALVLLVLPWAGYSYVREMERFLLAAQEQALAATARAVATALHDRPQLLAYRPPDESELRRQAERELQRLTGAPRTQDEAGAPDTEIAAILKGLQRASSRIWVVSRDY